MGDPASLSCHGVGDGMEFHLGLRLLSRPDVEGCPKTQSPAKGLRLENCCIVGGVGIGMVELFLASVRSLKADAATVRKSCVVASNRVSSSPFQSALKDRKRGNLLDNSDVLDFAYISTAAMCSANARPCVSKGRRARPLCRVRPKMSRDGKIGILRK